MNTIFLTVLSLLLMLPASMAQTFNLSDAPKAIQDLAVSIQGKSLREAHTIIIERLGPVQREVGSGVLIEQWDTSGGVLSYSGSGPVFRDSASRKMFRLIRTRSSVGLNILKNYEMTTLGTAADDGMHCWLGNVKFGPGRSYSFIDSKQFPEKRSAQNDNFFILNPAGIVEIRYAAPVTPETLLESLPEGTAVGQLLFTSANHRSQATFTITSSEQERYLTFGAEKPLGFAMKASWSNVLK